MAATPAAGAGAAPSFMETAPQLLLPVLLIVLFYFLLIRPQQRRLKQHQAMVSGIKRGDTVVLSSGIIGKVTRVDEAELQVEIAPNTNVKVVKGMVSEVRNRTAPTPANDTVKG